MRCSTTGIDWLTEPHYIGPRGQRALPQRIKHLSPAPRAAATDRPAVSCEARQPVRRKQSTTAACPRPAETRGKMSAGRGDGNPTVARLEPSFFFQAEDGIRYVAVTGVQTCALPI